MKFKSVEHVRAALEKADYICSKTIATVVYSNIKNLALRIWFSILEQFTCFYMKKRYYLSNH